MEWQHELLNHVYWIIISKPNIVFNLATFTSSLNINGKKDLLIGLNKPNQNNLCTKYLLNQWNKIVKQAFFFTPNLTSGTQRAISEISTKLHFFVDFLALFNTNTYFSPMHFALHFKVKSKVSKTKIRELFKWFLNPHDFIRKMKIDAL